MTATEEEAIKKQMAEADRKWLRAEADRASVKSAKLKTEAMAKERRVLADTFATNVLKRQKELKNVNVVPEPVTSGVMYEIKLLRAAYRREDYCRD